MKEDLPIEYKKGFVKFLNCKIDLSKKVFIPRIETEFWVKKAINEVRQATGNKRQERGDRQEVIRILDIFAGSGCLGIAILKNIKNSFVDFADIGKGAVEQIKINLKLSEIPKKRYRIYQSDLFKELKGKKYNFIFANPPYVAKERLKEVEPQVLKHEPKKAILAGKKGLRYIRKFLKTAKNFLKKEGIIFLEFDPLQEEEIENILESQGYKTPHQSRARCGTSPEPKQNFWFWDFKFFKDQFKKYRLAKIEKFSKI